MPRRSPSALALLSVTGEGPRLTPPPGLSEAEKKIFADVVLSVPPAHFQVSDGPLVAAYCRAAALEQLAAGELALLGYVGSKETAQWASLLAQATKSMLSLSIRLRLSPQGRKPSAAVQPAGRRMSVYDEMNLLEQGRDELDQTSQAHGRVDRS
jgi:hypothetical protein